MVDRLVLFPPTPQTLQLPVDHPEGTLEAPLEARNCPRMSLSSECGGAYHLTPFRPHYRRLALGAVVLSFAFNSDDCGAVQALALLVHS